MFHEQRHLGCDLRRPQSLARKSLFSTNMYPWIDLVLIIFRNNHIMLARRKNILLLPLFICVGTKQRTTTQCDYSKSETLRWWYVPWATRIGGIFELTDVIGDFINLCNHMPNGQQYRHCNIRVVILSVTWVEGDVLGVVHNKTSTKTIHNKKGNIAVSLPVEPILGLSFLMQTQV